MPGGAHRPFRPAIDDPDTLLDMFESFESPATNNQDIADEMISPYCPLQVALLPGTSFDDSVVGSAATTEVMDSYHFFEETMRCDSLADLRTAEEILDDIFDVDEDTDEFFDLYEDDPDDSMLQDDVEEIISDDEKQPLQPQSHATQEASLSDKDCEGERVQDFFNKLTELEGANLPERKRRRQRGKGPAEADEASPFAEAPRTRLKHLAAARGLSSRQFRMLLLCGIPMYFINLLAFVQSVFPRNQQVATECSELFAGAAMIHNAWTEQGRPASKFDIEHHRLFENILSAEGYTTAVKMVMGIKPGGLASFATVCSTWIYLSRSSTGRSAARPLGFASSCTVVANANCMCARVSILLVLCAIRTLIFLHEQPDSSLVPATPFFGWARDVIRGILHQQWNRAFTWMGAFGAETQKPTQLLSNAPWLHRLERVLTSAKRQKLHAARGVEHLQHDRATGKRRISGASGLKESQVYPAAYGRAVFDEWSAARQLQVIDSDSDGDSEAEIPWAEWTIAQKATQWPELRLHELQEFMPVPLDKPLL